MMSRTLQQLLIIVFAISMCSTPSFAQSAEENNFFIKNSITLVPKRDTETGELDTASSASSIFQSLANANTPWRETDEENAADSDEEESEEKLSELTQQLPLQGAQVLLQSDAIQKLYDNGMDGPVALHKITAHQTEPAVAAGVQGAEMSTANLQSLFYQSQQLLWTQYMSDPDLYRLSMSAYSRCMADATAKYNDQGAWVKALAECSGDGVSDSVQGAAALESSEDSSFSGKHHPDKQDGTSASDENAIRVSDLLFAVAEKNGVPGIQEIRESWLEMYGDYEIEIVAKDIGGEFFPIRTGKRKKIYPVANESAQESGRYSAGERITVYDLYRERLEQRFKTLAELLYGYCDSMRNPTTSSESHADDRRFFNRGGSSYSEQQLAEAFQLLSIPNRPLQAMTIEGLYNIFHSFGKDADGDFDCDFFQKDAQQMSEISGDDAYLLRGAHLMRKLAQLVAEGQMNNAFIQTESLIFNLNTGLGQENQIKLQALDLVYDAAKTRDLVALQDSLHQKMDALVSTILREQNRVTGTEGEGISTVVGSRNSKKDG